MSAEPFMTFRPYRQFEVEHTETGGVRLVDTDLHLRLKSGARLDLVALDEVARDLYGLDRNFTVELVSAEELREITGKGADGAHGVIAGDNFHSIAIDENLSAEECALALAHELGHAAHAQGMFAEGKSATAAEIAAYDADAETIAATYEHLAPAILRRAIVTAEPVGGAGTRSHGGRSESHRPAAAKSSTRPPDCDWPPSVRFNRESDRGALRRLDG